MARSSPSPSSTNKGHRLCQPGGAETNEDQLTVLEPEVIDLRASRLAELVAGLTGCEPNGALHAIRARHDHDAADALELVARAMVDVDQPPPEGFRVAGFLRSDLALTCDEPIRASEDRSDSVHGSEPHSADRIDGQGDSQAL